MMRSSLALLLIGGLLAAQPCTVAVGVPDNDPTAGTCNTFPFGQTSYTYVSRIAAGFMSNANPYVDDIAFSPCATGVFSANDIIVAMGHIPSPLPAAFNFPTFDAAGVSTGIGSFLDLTIIHNSFAGGTTGPASTTGPFSWNVTQNTWSPMGFSSSSGTGFLWNGTDDVGFFVTHQNATTAGSFHRALETRIYATGFNQSVCTTCNSAAALKIQLAVTQGPGLGSVPDWQCNQASSSLDVNGAPDPGPLGPMVTTVGAGTTVNVNFGGLAGSPYEIGVTTSPGVGVGAGGFLTPGGQAVNIDLSAPSLQFLFGLTFANSFSPFTLPVASPNALLVSAQLLVVDPGLSDGFALSHLNELNYVVCGVTENFDALATGAGVAPIGWTNPSAGNAWTVHTGGTPSSATGPTSAFSLPNYAYCETSGFTNSTFTFETCPVDATTPPLSTLSFQLSAIGATIGTLNVYQGDGAGTFNPTPIFTQTGAEPGQSQGGVEWTTKTIPLTIVNPLVAFRFEYLSGTSFTGDLAIDDIVVN